MVETGLCHLSTLTIPSLPRSMGRMRNQILRSTCLAIGLALGLAGCTGGESSSQAAWYSHNPLYAYSGEQGNLWTNLRTELKMPAYTNRPEVQQQIRWYQKHQSYLAHAMVGSAPYIYYIYEQTKKHNLPSELALIPIIESEYNPYAKSHAGAMGLWQMMPGTARDFGLRRDWWYDGRKDVVASTNAALQYFSYLHSYFDNWPLAIAAYDCGEGKVMQAMHYNKYRHAATDFWNLPLPTETRIYVPRLLALAAIVKNPARYHISLPPINNAPYVAQVNIGHPMDLNKAAKMAEVSPDTIRALNPGYEHGRIGPKGPYSLLIPKEKEEPFKLKLAVLSNKSKAAWQKHVVNSQENLAKIADMYNLTVAELTAVNDLHSDQLKPNQTLLIPPASLIQSVNPAAAIRMRLAANNTDKSTHSTEPTTTASNDNQNNADTSVKLAKNDDNNTDTQPTNTAVSDDANSSNNTLTYHIKKGDTLNKIAKKYQVKVADLRSWNKLSKRHILAIGDTLTIKTERRSETKEVAVNDEPNTNSVANAAEKEPQLALNKDTSDNRPQTNETNTKRTYVVKSGDYIGKIAKRYHVTSDQILQWNRLSEEQALQPGQKLVIEADA